MASTRTADSWFPELIVESKVKKGLREYVSKTLEAPECRCEKPVTHEDVDGYAICCYCGR